MYSNIKMTALKAIFIIIKTSAVWVRTGEKVCAQIVYLSTIDHTFVHSDGTFNMEICYL